MPSLTLFQGPVFIDGPLRVEHNGTLVDLVGLLSSHEGRDVEAVVYHFPLGGLDPTKPGAGSCLWESGKCPYHRDKPSAFHSVKARGVLARNEHGWSVGDTPLHLDFLRGHYAGIVLFPVPDLSASTPSAVTPEDLSVLSSYMGQMQDLLAQVRTRRNGQG